LSVLDARDSLRDQWVIVWPLRGGAESLMAMLAGRVFGVYS
jgi:hypothetical protein